MEAAVSSETLVRLPDVIQSVRQIISRLLPRFVLLCLLYTAHCYPRIAPKVANINNLHALNNNQDHDIFFYVFRVVLFNLLAPELFFLNFSTPCI